MLKNIVPRERKTIVEYSIDFDLDENSGFTFPCDAEGNLLDPDNDCMMRNYRNCMEHPEKFVRWNKLVRRHRTYTEPAHGTCVCGREVELYDQYYGACSCECGRWYNLFGQELLPPEQWQDDPNESDAWDGYEPQDYWEV